MTKINSKYHVIKEIGSGAFAHVYKARNLESERVVAVKELNIDDEEETEREICLLRRLADCDQIINLIECFKLKDTWCLVLDYYQTDLEKHFLTLRQPLQLTTIWSYAQQILIGLGYCHDMRVIHRDLKLNNILLNKKGEIALCDFNSSVLLEGSMVQTSFTYGACNIRPPELLLGAHSYGPEVDMWAVGLILVALRIWKICVINPFNFEPKDYGSNIDNTLRAICQKLGPITEHNLPGCTSLPEWNNIYSSSHSSFDLSFPEIEDELSALIKPMLRYNPRTRLTARAALQAIN